MCNKVFQLTLHVTENHICFFGMFYMWMKAIMYMTIYEKNGIYDKKKIIHMWVSPICCRYMSLDYLLGKFCFFLFHAQLIFSNFCTGSRTWYVISGEAQTVCMQWKRGQWTQPALLYLSSCDLSTANYQDELAIDLIAQRPTAVSKSYSISSCLEYLLRTLLIPQVWNLLITGGRYVPAKTTINKHSCVRTI